MASVEGSSDRSWTDDPTPSPTGVSGEASAQLGEHALVLGAGVAGLLAASVLARRFARVTVVERDGPPDKVAARKGVPQANHIHLLLIRGAQIIERLYPGFFDELEQDGGLVADSTRDLAFYHFGQWQPRGFSGLPTRMQSRALLEWHLYRRTSALPNVDVAHGAEVVEPVLDASARVRGVQLRRQATGETEEVGTDLVVDAAGRASPTPRWLKHAGLERPTESKVGLPITYASRFFEAPADHPDWQAMLVYPWAPHEHRGGALYLQEGNRWIATIASYRAETPPTSDDEFLRFAAGLPNSEIHDQIARATPASPIHTYHYPGARLVHYEKLRETLGRLVVLGDAVASVNPVFGQGMTSAALQVEALAGCLESTSELDAGFECSFARAASRACRQPWFMSTTMDLRYPYAEGDRSIWQPLINAYLGSFFRSTANSQGRLEDLMRVLHLVSGPERWFRPAALAAVVSAARWTPSAPDSSVPPPPRPRLRKVNLAGVAEESARG
ncbi:MAG: NAD(P)/FAD-dependent oxidoreductase [Myxococcota bacterium]